MHLPIRRMVDNMQQSTSGSAIWFPTIDCKRANATDISIQSHLLHPTSFQCWSISAHYCLGFIGGFYFSKFRQNWFFFNSIVYAKLIWCSHSLLFHFLGDAARTTNRWNKMGKWPIRAHEKIHLLYALLASLSFQLHQEAAEPDCRNQPPAEAANASSVILPYSRGDFLQFKWPFLHLSWRKAL